jgi:hypothetical protein
MSIYYNLGLHLQGIDGLDKSWENIEVVFGKQNIVQAYSI